MATKSNLGRQTTASRFSLAAKMPRIALGSSGVTAAPRTARPNLAAPAGGAPRKSQNVGRPPKRK